jgi:signal-transduction protein with cAMP-binding, CBS, and nucleotidyltransferase domain
MAIDRVVAPLLRVPLFAGLKPLQITEIARQAEKLSFRPNQIITKAGQPGDGAFLIVAGLAVCVEDPEPLATPEPVAPGSLVGEMAMLTEHEYGSTIVAQERVLCLKIARVTLHAQMLEDSSLAEHFRERISARLRRVREELRQIDSALAACGTDPPVSSSVFDLPRVARAS